MIGKIEFEHRGEVLQATLEDGRAWTCSDQLIAKFLNLLAPPGPGYLPPGGQLRDGAALQSGRIIEEVEVEYDPDVAY